MVKGRQPSAVSLFERVQRLLDNFPIEKLPARSLFLKLRTVLQFLLLVWRGFDENRCPIRAARCRTRPCWRSCHCSRWC